MLLQDYIAEVGDEAAGEQFGVSARTALSWRLGTRSPRPKKAKLIEEKTGGRVTFAECYQGRSSTAA